ncbi:MAG: hypothetical protein VB036_11305 [Propionicimonas sp.]|nr:hypothetical protein [Propionicimonas sp.]
MLVLPQAGRPFAKAPYLVFLILVVATEPWRPANYFEGSFDSVVILKGLLSVIAAATAWWLIRDRPRRTVPAWPAVLMTLYLAITVFGGWANGSLMASVVIVVRVLILILTVYLLLSGYDGYAVMAGLVGALATVALFSVLTNTGRPFNGRLAGGLPPLHPNEIAAISAVVILWLIHRGANARESLADFVALGAAGYALIATESRTSLMMVVPAAAILILMARRVHLRVLLPFLVGLPTLVIVLFSGDFLTEALTRGGSEEDITSLSNRTIAWTAALMPKSNHWLTWLGGGLSMKQIEVPGQWWSHQILDSSWISALVQSGYLGVVLCLALILYGVACIIRTPGELRAFRLAVVTFLSLRGVLESGLFDASTAFLVCFTALALPDARGQLHPTPAPVLARATLPSTLWQPSQPTIPGKSMRSIKSRLLAAAGVVVLALVATGLFNFFAPRQYDSAVSLYATAAGRQVRASDIYQGTMMVSARMNTYVELATSPMVLDAVISELHLEGSAASLSEQVAAVNPPGTAVLTITVTDPVPEQAQVIATTVAAKFQNSVELLESGSGATAQVDFQTLGPAQLPLTPSSPDQLRNLLIAALAGGVLGLGILLWPIARIASSPDKQLRIILLGPLADRLDPQALQLVGGLTAGPAGSAKGSSVPDGPPA